jgi:predicted dehydrogenase
MAHTMGGYAVNAVTWLLDCLPDWVFAAGGTDYYDGKEGRPLYENPDNFTAVFGFTSGDHTLRYNCQVNLDTESGNYYEKVMGLQGWAIISEQPYYGNEVFRNREEPWEKYEQAIRDGVIKQLWSNAPLTEASRLAETIDAHSSPTDVNLSYYQLTVRDADPPHSYHLENFLSVLRAGGPQSSLACPAEEAWKTLVCMAKLQESIDQRREVPIAATDFAV